MNSDKFTSLMIILSFIGLSLTVYLIFQHYFGSSICDLSKFISCSTVNSSSYSEIFGIPIAVLGTGYFVLMIVFFSLYQKNKNFLKYALYLSIITIIPSLYLTFIEFTVINAVCIFCESTKLVMITIIAFSIYQLRKEKESTTTL